MRTSLYGEVVVHEILNFYTIYLYLSDKAFSLLAEVEFHAVVLVRVVGLNFNLVTIYNVDSVGAILWRYRLRVLLYAVK